MHSHIPREGTEFIDRCKQLSYTELDDLCIELGNSINRIKAQIEDAHAHGYTTNKEGDTAWESKARTALRWNKWRLATAESYKARARQSSSFALTFMECARALLPPQQYTLVYEEALGVHSEQDGYAHHVTGSKV